MKKIVKIVAAVCALSVCLPFAACAKKDGNESKRSSLIGTYTYQKTLGADTAARELVITNNADNTAQSGVLFSTVFPIAAGSEGTRVSYIMDQRLKLNGAYTYKYECYCVL